MFPLPAARWRPPGRSLPVEDGPSLSCVLTHCDGILSDETDIYKLMTQPVYYSAYCNRIGYEIPKKGTHRTTATQPGDFAGTSHSR